MRCLRPSSCALLFVLFVVTTFGLATALRLPAGQRHLTRALDVVFGVALGGALCVSTPCLPSLAVSGGGKDYATKDIKGDTSFAGAKNIGKDFTQVDAKGVDFRNSDLSGSRFYRAKLESAKFDAAILQGASLEDSDLVDASFEGANLSGAYLSASIEEVKTIKGADFSDALMQEKTKQKLCQRSDATGTNPVTGVETRDSLMCDD